ncbi:MAG TPA: beta-ketoacyl synthase N-terminal-like domain-containing protein, partial [Azonexus sp.]|nr:beta-ketoacyl synthase N-terminal-like domain-containing protein [Azonexus sp.]
MSGAPIYISGMGIVSPMGCGVADTAEALRQAQCALRPLTLFGLTADVPPAVGEVNLESDSAYPLPRTHRLARIAADQILATTSLVPDAIVIGTTTGGILTTEELLEKNVAAPDGYRYHGVGTVAEDLARRFGCSGPLITVSTACSSGALALILAMEMLRSGKARRVLAGGVDSLCRLTYFGFNSLQLIDPVGARPLDRDRRGLSVAEGAGLLLLTTEPPGKDALQLLGAGLSCDAYHPAAPRPDGKGAVAAMRAALADAGLEPADIDYINLHGTGTTDNDLAEINAIKALFGDSLPLLSSIKGATGHALAAAGAIEAVVAAIAIDTCIVPANVGFQNIDPALSKAPVTTPTQASIKTVLSNSFGFGGNNAALAIGTARNPSSDVPKQPRPPLIVTAAACLTGAGHTQETWESFSAGRACNGCLDDGRVTEGLPPRTIRRLKRLPKLALALANHTCRSRPDVRQPVAVSLGTAWGALSETHDFLHRLFETNQQFPSPTDFIGSVHNAPAGQIAMHLDSRGANVTTSGGDWSFEQALLAADLLTHPDTGPTLLVGVDEAQPCLSPLFDGSVGAVDDLGDGGGALLLERGSDLSGATVDLLEYRFGIDQDFMVRLVGRLGGPEGVGRDFGAIMAGLPAGNYTQAAGQLADFVQQSNFNGPIVDYRRIVGQFGAASAVAAVL